MTTTVYTATFVDADGKKFHGTICWDKYSPRRLDATLCRHITESEVDYPQWTQSAPYGRGGLETLMRRMKSKTAKMHLTLVSEAETAFSVRADASWA
jgi:hypothetical protein